MSTTNLACSIDFDDEWTQEDCHWNYKRVFTITWFVPNIYEAVSKSFYYRFGGAKDGNYVSVDNIKQEAAQNGSKYTYHLYLVENDNLAQYRDEDGFIKIYAKISVIPNLADITTKVELETNFKTKLPAAEEADGYLLELPPKQLKEVTIENNITTAPGSYTCKWTLQDEPYYNNPTESIAGFCIELSKSEDGETFTGITGLSWNQEKLGQDPPVYELVRTTIVPPAFDDGGTGIDECSYSSVRSSKEIYLENPDVRSFDFSPDDLGIEKGESYRITVYPYTVYGSYLQCYEEGGLEVAENVPGTKLASDGRSSDGEVPKGIVHVFDGNGWREGFVWVRTDSGWQEAEAVYVMTDNGWSETL